MVRSLISIAAALALLFGMAFFERGYVTRQFEGFREELQTLYDKTQEGDASGEDADAVRMRWEVRRDRLHVWIPHGDIARIDEVLSETMRLIAEREYGRALPKLEMLLHACTTVPGTYHLTLANLF